MKVSELEGSLLDYWVSRALGMEDTLISMARDCCWDSQSDSAFSPSSNWADGGPIIERERITLLAPEFDGNIGWEGIIAARLGYDSAIDGTEGIGPTPLIAAMRAFVASKLGEEVVTMLGDTL